MTSNLRTTFEKQLRDKLTQKTNSFQSEETILIKAFRFFDLDNSGTVEFAEFAKAIQKIGIQISGLNQLKELFDYYDADHSGALDYKEFASMVFNNASPATRMLSNEPKRIKYKNANIENLLRKVRTTLNKRGHGILSLARQFSIADHNNNRSLDKHEFNMAMVHFGTGLDETESTILFEYFDTDKSGFISYDEFIYNLAGEMNDYRRKLVEQAFKKLDRDQSGAITIDDLRGVYNASNHPDVRSGKKTENQILTEFLNGFESLYDHNRIQDDKVTLDEFIQYYTFLSASIDSDTYFETMITNSWRLNEGIQRKPLQAPWAHDYGSEVKPKQPILTASQYAKREAARGSESYQPVKSQSRGFEQSYQQPQSTKNQGSRGFDQDFEKAKKSAPPTKYSKETAYDAIDKIREKLLQRAARGFIGLQRQFKVIDDDQDGELSYNEFAKALKDFKINITEEEARAAFCEFDVDNSGRISIDEFIRGVRGQMNSFRADLVRKAFAILDKDGDGVIRVNDIRSVYSAKSHPDVRSGRRSEVEILGEFLETFESHHNIRTGVRDQNVTLEEFMEYYNNVSANIDDDKYFEHMIVTGFRLDTARQPETRPGWGQSYAGNQRKRDYNQPTAPYGVSEGPTDYSTSQRPQTSQQPTRTGITRKVHTTTTPWGVDNQPTDYSTTSQRPQTAQSNQRQQQYQEYQQYDYPEKNVRSRQESGQQQRSRLDSGQQQASNVDSLLSALRDKLVSRGARGILGLARLFKNIDDNNSRSLDFQEFSKCLNEIRLNFSPNDIKAIFADFDRDRSGTIDYDEFLRAVRGPLSPSRLQWVKEAFKKLDANGNGIVTLEDVKGVYNCKNHPDVRSGKRTEDEVLIDFLDTFEQHHAIHTGDMKQRNAQVTFEEFVEYYSNISCSIDDDRYFEQMMKTAWKLDGQTGPTQRAWRTDYGGRY